MCNTWGSSPHVSKRLSCWRYFCRWLATFSLVMPSTFISCRIVLGTAFLTPCSSTPGHTTGLSSSCTISWHGLAYCQGDESAL